MPPFNKDVVFKRIENAIRLKDSATFLEIEKMLKEEKDYIIKEKPISISYGVACMEDGGQELKKYIDIADKMMYKSKKEYRLKKAR